MIRVRAAVMLPVLTLGCAPLSPEAKLREDLVAAVYWDAGRECESRYRTLRLVRVGRDGDLTVDAAADSKIELRAFTECYHQAIGKRVELRRQKGEPVPEGLNLTPSVDLD